MTFKFEAEVRLIRWSESSTAGRTITIELPPDAGEAHPFRGLPTGHQHGQRFLMQFAAIGDDERPEDPKAQLKGMLERSLEHEVKPKGLEASLAGKQRYANSSAMEQARDRSILLPKKDLQFRAWAYRKYCGPDRHVDMSTYDVAVRYIRERCGVESRSEIAADPDAYREFIEMETAYKIETGQFAESRG
jgi:hypothetical protein